MRSRFVRCLALGPVIAVLVPALGCHRPIQPEAVTAETVAPEAFRDLWDAALTILRRHDFEPERQDWAMGVIVSKPTTSRQWGEFWRQDVAGPYDLALASLHTAQRKATVRFIRDADLRMEVQVDVYRLSMPEHQITSASSAIQSFSGLLPTTEGRIYAGDPSQRHWVHLGRDGRMEERLLRRILAYAGQTAWAGYDEEGP